MAGDDDVIEACLRTIQQAPRPVSSSSALATAAHQGYTRGEGASAREGASGPGQEPSDLAAAIGAVKRLQAVVFQSRLRSVERGRLGEGTKREEAETHRRRGREEDREKQRELERVHRSLPVLGRLHQRLIAPHNSTTPASAILLLAVIDFFLESDEEGLPHLPSALSSFLTIFLSRHYHNEEVATACFDCFLRMRMQIQAQDPNFFLEWGLLFTKTFASHISLLQERFLQLLPHLISPSTVLQLVVAILDLPVLVMALEEQKGTSAVGTKSKAGSTTTTTTSTTATSSTTENKGVAGAHGAGGGTGVIGEGVAGKGSASAGGVVSTQGASGGRRDGKEQPESPTINVAEMMALMDSSFTGTDTDGAMYDSGDESLHGGGGGKETGGYAGGAPPRNPKQAKGLLLDHLLLDKWDVFYLTSLWHTPGLLELLSSSASGAKGNECIDEALAASPLLLAQILTMVTQRLPPVTLLLIFPLLLKRYPLMLLDLHYSHQVQAVIVKWLLLCLSGLPQILFLLQMPICDAIANPRSSRPQVELSRLLVWVVGEYISPATAAAEASRGGQVMKRTWDESGVVSAGDPLYLARQVELTSAQALLEAVELVLYESLSRRGDSEEEQASADDAGWVLTPMEMRDAKESLLFCACTALGRLAAARWELRARARISVAKVGRSQGSRQHPLVKLVAQDNLAILRQAPQLL